MDKNKIRESLETNIGVFKNMEKDDLGYIYNSDGIPSHPYVDELIHRTEQALSELDTDDWIKVADRLPECGDPKDENEGWLVYKSKANRKKDVTFTHPSWWVEDNGTSQEITHWQPLPSNPKE